MNMSKQYLAIYFGENRVCANTIVETTEPQALAEYLASREDVGFPLEIQLVETREENLCFEGKTWHYPPPTLLKRYIRGRDFSERVETLDQVCQTVKDWIDNLDEPEAVAELLKKVTGAMDVRIIGSGIDAKIAYDIPYNKE